MVGNNNIKKSPINQACKNGLENARSFLRFLPALLRLPRQIPPLCQLARVHLHASLRLHPRRHLDTTPPAPRPKLLQLPPDPVARNNLDLLAPLRLKDHLALQSPHFQLWRVLVEIANHLNVVQETFQVKHWILRAKLSPD